MANATCTGLVPPALFEMCNILTATPVTCAANQFPFVSGNETLCGTYTDTVQKVTGMLGLQGTLDNGNTAFMLGSSALVMIMTPGLGFFYGGLAGQESVSNTLLMSVACIFLVSFQWFLIGYSFAFGPGNAGFGSFEWFALLPITSAPSGAYGINIPHILYCVFQCMFAQITPAIISGGVVGRMKFSSFCIFVLLWTTFIYDPLAHWFWSITILDDFSGTTPLGWLGHLGAIDFAGGNVIHISSGFSGLAAALVLGRRLNHGEKLKPHNVPMIVLGVSLVWFGWFGFNAGSAGGAGAVGGFGPNNILASTAFINTHLAASSAGLTWIAMEALTGGKPSAAGIASGAVVGLVAITPGSGFVLPYASILFGIFAVPPCFFACRLKYKLGIDDTLDAFALHGVGGAMGALMTGLFATQDVNAFSGGFYGGSVLFGYQLLAVTVTSSFSFCGTIVLMLALKYTIGVRVDEDKEREGMDMSEHGGKSYQ